MLPHRTVSLAEDRAPSDPSIGAEGTCALPSPSVACNTEHKVYRTAKREKELKFDRSEERNICSCVPEKMLPPHPCYQSRTITSV